VRRDVVILACAISAGIHGALVPEHFAEGMGPGVGFVVATGALAFVAAALNLRLASYALAITTGLPVLHPDSEPVDGLALATKAIEAAGLLAALGPTRRPSLALSIPDPKGTT
jgi:hypothetical protein